MSMVQDILKKMWSIKFIIFWLTFSILSVIEKFVDKIDKILMWLLNRER